MNQHRARTRALTALLLLASTAQGQSIDCATIDSGGEAMSAITCITLSPGFRLDENGYSSATIAACNSPGSG